MQNASDSPPSTHFSELVMYLKKNPVKNSVYIHTSPTYLALLIGASLGNATIILAHDYQDKSLLMSNFVLNDLKDKVLL